MPPWFSRRFDPSQTARRLAAHGLGLIVLVGALGTACRRSADVGLASPPLTREAVWRAIQPLAERYRLEAGLIYGLVAAESNFDARAVNGEARGLLQLKPGAWRTITTDPYDPGVWHWQRNLEVGVEYLAWTRSELHRHRKFSEPLLLAAFHYGFDYVEDRNFDLRRLDPPDNAIYREMWSGNLLPVPPPKLEIPR